LFRATSSLASLEHKAAAFDILTRHLALTERTVKEWEDQNSRVPDDAFDFSGLVNALCAWKSMGLARACFEVSSQGL
jgi:hypothetical protein